MVTITGDERGAGTDANVFVTLFGEYGITPKVHLASKYDSSPLLFGTLDVGRLKLNVVLFCLFSHSTEKRYLVRLASTISTLCCAVVALPRLHELVAMDDCVRLNLYINKTLVKYWSTYTVDQ